MKKRLEEGAKKGDKRGTMVIRFDSEANVAAEFYHECRLLGMTLVMEFSTPVGRLDIAIMNKERTRLLGIVEAKRKRRLFKDGESAQIKRYKCIGVAVWGLAVGEDAKAFAQSIKSQLEKVEGKLLSEIFSAKTQHRLRGETKDLRINEREFERKRILLEKYQEAQKRIDEYRENLNVRSA